MKLRRRRANSRGSSCGNTTSRQNSPCVTAFRAAAAFPRDVRGPVDFSAFTLLHPGAGSAAQEIAGKAPGARVVKAFNTTFAGTLLEGRVERV